MTIQERQDAIENFVAREVYVCQSMLIEATLKKELFTYDDIQNLYRPFDGGLLAPNVCSECRREYSVLDSETGKCQECHEASQMPQEIYEWWLVSPWLCKKLLIEGEPVLENEYGTWWGRCTTGQAISMDYIIQKIYDDMMSYTG